MDGLRYLHLIPAKGIITGFSASNKALQLLSHKPQNYGHCDNCPLLHTVIYQLAKGL